MRATLSFPLQVVLFVLLFVNGSHASVVLHDGHEGIVATSGNYALDSEGRFWDLDSTVGWTHIPQRDLPMPVSAVRFWSGLWLFTMDDHAWAWTAPQSWRDLGQWPASAAPQGQPDLQVSVTAAPNPTAAGCRIAFETAAAGRVSVLLYDAVGRTIRQLHDAPLPPGVFSLAWDGCDDSGAEVPSGVYFAKITAEEGERTTRVVLTR